MSIFEFNSLLTVHYLLSIEIFLYRTEPLLVPKVHMWWLDSGTQVGLSQLTYGMQVDIINETRENSSYKLPFQDCTQLWITYEPTPVSERSTHLFAEMALDKIHVNDAGRQPVSLLLLLLLLLGQNDGGVVVDRVLLDRPIHLLTALGQCTISLNLIENERRLLTTQKKSGHLIGNNFLSLS